MSNSQKLISGLEIAEAPMRLLILRLKFELIDRTTYEKLKRGIENIIESLENNLTKELK